MAFPRTIVYVDGFNFYYGAVKNTPFKWLDFFALSQRLLPQNDVLYVKYFTAMVSGKDDPQSPVRQDIYLRALRARGNIEIILGLFKSWEIWRPVCVRTNGFCQLRSEQTIKAKVLDTKEKGSDVNLAAHVLNDAWLNAYDVAVIISNDSDLVAAIQFVKQYTKKVIGIINPRGTGMVSELKRLADFTKDIREHDLKSSQLPAIIPGTNLKKPDCW